MVGAIVAEPLKFARDRWLWLREHQQSLAQCFPLQETLKAVAESDGMTQQTRILQSGNRSVWRLKNGGKVVGMMSRTESGNLGFNVRAYEANERIGSGFTNPNYILKPTLIGSIEVGKEALSVIRFAIVASFPCRTFFWLLKLALVFVIGSVACALALGFSVPSASYLLLVASAVMCAFALMIQSAVPRARQEEQTLLAWMWIVAAHMSKDRHENSSPGQNDSPC